MVHIAKGVVLLSWIPTTRCKIIGIVGRFDVDVGRHTFINRRRINCFVVVQCDRLYMPQSGGIQRV